MTRTEYNRAYYQGTRARRLMLAVHRRQIKRWAPWLLTSLEWPPEPAVIVPPTQPIRRPTLRLKTKRNVP